MDKNERNTNRCPLVNQTGEAGVLNFKSLLSALPPDQRQAFEHERAARQDELDSIRSSSMGLASQRTMRLA
jgi:hypothetical protein